VIAAARLPLAPERLERVHPWYEMRPLAGWRCAANPIAQCRARTDKRATSSAYGWRFAGGGIELRGQQCS